MVLYVQKLNFRNFAANNYYPFSNEIYFTFYLKIAMYRVSEPDILFFISSYVLESKCFKLYVLERHQLKTFLVTKLGRLYPLYITAILIYSRKVIAIIL
jgi:hypothetical protein